MLAQQQQHPAPEGPRTASPAPSSSSSPRLPPLEAAHSALCPGPAATLLDFTRTLEMYRENARRSPDPAVQLEFARFLLQMAAPSYPDRSSEFRMEAFKLCKRAAATGNDEAQFLLAECYESGAAATSGKPDYSKAFGLYLQAAKHQHPEAAYRAAVYYENGRGTSKSPQRAVQFYQKAAAMGHPGALYRLAMADLHGELGMSVNPRNGIKWLKHAAAAATPEHPEALYELAVLHEHGVEHVLFVDYDYAVKLLRQAAQMGHVMAMYRLGSYYEHGNHVAKNAHTSFAYYKAAAERGHSDSMFGVASWYLTGNPDAGVPQSDDLAFEWMTRAADAGLTKAFFALAYFYEEAIGTSENLTQAMHWYKLAHSKGDKRAAPKLKAIEARLAAVADPIVRSRAPPQPVQASPPKKKKMTAAEIEAERQRLRKARTGEDACVVM